MVKFTGQVHVYSDASTKALIRKHIGHIHIVLEVICKYVIGSLGPSRLLPLLEYHALPMVEYRSKADGPVPYCI